MNIRSHVAALTEIDGIAQRTADKLATEGIATLEQVRDLTEDEVDRLDVKLGLRGQIRNMRWREQAAELLFNMEADQQEETVAVTASAPEVAMTKLSAEFSALQSKKVELKEKRLRLNPNRDFGETYGTDKDADGNATGAFFSQVRNGVETYFNFEKVEIKPGDKSQPDPTSDEVEGTHDATDYNDFHPINYLDGKVDYPFEFVRRAIQSRFGRAVKTERHAKAMLHEQLRQNH
jgi:hypothetical protein